MSIKTRLDGRSENNNLITIVTGDGLVLAEIKVLSDACVLEVDTMPHLYIAKPNGFVSNHKRVDALV